MTRAVTGIVLAGGRASRMGRDKAMLMLDGHTLLDLAIRRLRDAGATCVRVSGERPVHGGIPDRSPYPGPVGGLASVLPHCDDGAALVLPVDMPRLGVDRLRALLDALDAARMACFDGHPLPCALEIDAASRAAVARLVAERPGGPSVRDLRRALGGVEFPVADAAVLASINTPADWEALTK